MGGRTNENCKADSSCAHKDNNCASVPTLLLTIVASGKPYFDSPIGIEAAGCPGDFPVAAR